MSDRDDVVEKIDRCGDDAVNDFAVKNAIDVENTSRYEALFKELRKETKRSDLTVDYKIVQILINDVFVVFVLIQRGPSREPEIRKNLKELP